MRSGSAYSTLPSPLRMASASVCASVKVIARLARSTWLPSPRARWWFRLRPWRLPALRALLNVLLSRVLLLAALRYLTITRSVRGSVPASAGSYSAKAGAAIQAARLARATRVSRVCRLERRCEGAKVCWMGVLGMVAPAAWMTAWNGSPPFFRPPGLRGNRAQQNCTNRPSRMPTKTVASPALTEVSFPTRLQKLVKTAISFRVRSNCQETDMLLRWRSQASSASGRIARASSQPCIRSQPSWHRKSRWAAVSTPSASTCRPRS